jgi:3-oxocholest-4-en-26-oyl-CoA dehydrogenase beta subunit
VDFGLSEEQGELAGLVREIAGARAADGPGGVTDAAGFDAGLWGDLAKAGVLSAALPDAAGGAGLDLLAQCSVLAELGRAVAPAPYLGSIVLGAGAIAGFGSAEQVRRWAEPAGRGEVVLAAALEDEVPVTAEAGAEDSSAAAGAWVLSGVKTAVGGAPWADAFLVPAATADGARVFVVTASDAGVTVQRQELTDGATAGRLVLDGVRLGADRVLGGASVVGWLTDRATVGLCALQLGVTERALELTAEYAKNRVQFARPIGSFQAVAQRLADGWIDVEAIRLTLWQAAWRLTSGWSAGDDLDGTTTATAIATAKFWAAEAGHRVAHTAVHVHGGVGIDVSHPLHRYFAAAKHYEFALGGATAQLLHIGAALAER